jgi:hypothetical protein
MRRAMADRIQHIDAGQWEHPAFGPHHHTYLDDSVEREPVNFDKYQRMKLLVTHALEDPRHFTYFHDVNMH